ncbi:MAG: glycosyltransferase family 39 protein [Patescibacteria group bacterium]
MMTKPSKIFIILLSLVLIFLAVEIIYYVFFLDTWLDEADFAYKPWLTSQDLAQPFTDFRSKYPPLVFYSQALFQSWFGPTLLGSRILSALFLAASALLLYAIGKRLGGQWTGLVSLSLLVFNPYLVGFYTAAKDYPQAMFFSLLGLWVLGGDGSPKKKVLLVSIFFTAAVLIRYNMIPVLGSFWLYIIWHWRSVRYLLLSILFSVGIFLVALIPYLLLDPHYAIIWAVIMFGPLGRFFATDYFSNFSNSQVSFGSDHFKFLIQIFTKYFNLWIIFMASIIFTLIKPKTEMKKLLSRHHLLVFSFFLAMVFFASHIFIPNEFSTHLKFLYVAPFLIIAAAGSIGILFRWLNNNPNTDLKLALGCFLAVLITFPAVSTALAEPYIIFFNRLDWRDSDIQRVTRGGEYLRSVTTSEDVILAIGTAHHSFLAGRLEIPPLINGEFTYYEIADRELLERYKFYNFPILLDWLTNKATVVVFQEGALGESSVFGHDQEKINLFLTKVRDNYELIGNLDNAYPKKYSRSGIMQVYRRKQ